LRKLLLAGFSYPLAFILCGLIGATGVVAGVPALRENCDEGVVCYALQILRIIPLPRRTVVDPDPRPNPTRAPQSGCLTATDRAVLYRLGMTLIGNPIPNGTEIPDALAVSQADCIPVEDFAKQMCTSLGQEWSMGPPVNCEFRSNKPAN
jgi:hypothetical protein